LVYNTLNITGRTTPKKEVFKMKKNIAIIGFGGMGRWHGDYLMKSDVCNLLGVWDINPDRLVKARSLGIGTYSPWKSFLMMTVWI
jgi:predicted dehydrogenase